MTEIASENLLIPVTAGHVTARKAETAHKLAENALQKEKLSAILNT